MASGLGSPFDGRTPNPNSSIFSDSACSGGSNSTSQMLKRGSNSISYLFGSGWQNAHNVALVVVESICIAALFGTLFATYHSRYTHEGKRDNLRINSMRGAVLSTMLAVCLAISFIVLKTGFSCLFRGCYPYLYAIFGLGWRGAEIVTALIIARTAVEQLRNCEIKNSELVSRGFSAWIGIMVLTTVASYVLYLLWMIRLFVGAKVNYATTGFGRDYAKIDFGYQVGYLVLSLAFLGAVLFSLRQHLTPKPRRNLLLLIVVLLVVREIEQVVINALITFTLSRNLSAISLADAIIYDTTTTGIFFSLALLGRRDPNEQGVGASFQQQLEGDAQKPIGGPMYGDAYETKPAPLATTHVYDAPSSPDERLAYDVPPPVENHAYDVPAPGHGYAYYPNANPHF